MVTVIIVLAAAVGLFFLVKSRLVPDMKVTTADIPLIYEKLKSTGKNGNFATLALMPKGKTSVEDAIDIQFSIENRKIGFDWVLIGRGNIQDQGSFTQFAARLGYTVAALEMNKVKYLRVDTGDLPKLAEAVVLNLYSMPPDTVVHLIPQGFAWP